MLFVLFFFHTSEISSQISDHPRCAIAIEREKIWIFLCFWTVPKPLPGGGQGVLIGNQLSIPLPIT